MTDFRYSAGVDVNLNIKGASSQLQDLWKQLQKISNMKVDIGAGNLTADIEKASEAAMKLSAHLATALNPRTGNLDFTKFYTSIQKSGASLQEYGEALQRMGPAGQKAFVSLADSISKSEIPLKRTSQMVDKMWDGLKRTASWQLQSSIIHGIMGSIQSAVGYAKDLNSSLNDIRIVTGQSTDQMAKFAKEANQAAKSLSTTTTDYTKASLIYYQQGLSDAEVKQRTETTIKMANVSGQSAEHVSSQMTAIWNNFDNGSKSLQYYGDVITALGAKTASSSEEIAQGMQKFAAISDTIGLSYEYAASALATVTATTRESADIVGNSYKTLFSRIQGLQLGETLDDGTTLNKYSAALAQVGISIKDSSGNLKDMDSILNEMGSKWETLSKDQQMALAQTVAGVRQYTQLVALMDNWDTFQQNLQIAKSSSGTLDAQAAIYAESWEAASDRVRASWEGLWDNLIDSEGFIAILDMTSGLVGILDNMVTGLGGAGGALATFGGILTKVFNKQIVSTISDVAYFVKMLKPGALEDMKKNQLDFINQAKASMSQDYINPLYGPNESRIRRESMSSSLDASRAFLENRDHMTEQQLLLEQMFADQDKTIQQQKIEAARNIDQAHIATADSYFKLFSDTENMSGHYLTDTNFYTSKNGQNINEEIQQETKKQIDALKSEQVQLLEGDITPEVNQRFDEIERLIPQVEGKVRQKYQSSIPTYKDELTSRAGKLAEIYQGFNNVFKNNGSKDAESTLQSLTDLVTNLGDPNNSEAIKTLGNSEFFTNLSKGLQGLQFETDANGNKVLTAESSQYLSKQMAQLQGFSTTSMTGLADQITERIRASGKFTGDANKLQSQIRELAQSYLAENYAKNRFDNINMRPFDPNNENDPRVQNMKKQDIQNKTQGIVSAAQGLMQVAAAGESIKALAVSLQEGTASFSSTLTAITSSILQSAMGFQGLNSALAMIPSLGAGAASGIALAVTALLVLASTAAEFWDQTHTSNKEMMQNLANSNSELTTASSSAAKAAETAKIQNEEYLTGVEKIKSLSQDPTTLAEDIYESNKKALELINQYNLQGGVDYLTGANGLIEIKKESLQQEEANRNNISQNADYASILGQALNQKKSDQIERTEDQFSQMIDNFSNEINPFDKLWANEEQKAFLEKYNTDADANKFNIEELAQIYQDGQLQKYTELFSKASSIESLETAIQDYLDNKADVELNDAAVDNATNIVANKILADNGITAATQEGFSGYQAVVADSIKQQFQEATDVVDTIKNRILNEDAIKQILESQGQKGAHGFRVDSGVVYYTLDGESQERSYTGETLNYLNAANQIDNKKAIDAANEAWKKAITNFGEDAAEAGLNIEQLGTISGASADSVQALFAQGKEAFKSAYGDNKAAATKEYAKVNEIFGDDGIVKALGLDPATLSEVSMGTLETLQNQAEGMGAEGATYIGELFEGIKDATNAETAEDLSKIVTALSSMDFSKNAYLNLTDLQATLEAFGFSVDTGGLEALYAILVKLAGLSPGGGLGDLADINKEIANKRGALNEVAPGGEVDEATMQNAKKAGLTEGWIKSGDSKYTYTGTQEDIDREKNRADKAWADSQASIDAEQAAYSKATEQGMNLSPSGNYNTDTLMSALGYKKGFLGFGTGWEEDTTQLDALAEALGMTSDEIKSQLEAGNSDFVERVNNFLKNGSMTDQDQSAGAEDFMTNIASAQDMMNAVNEASERGDTAGFIDENGIISEEAINRLQTFEPTSQRTAQALENLNRAQADYAPVAEKYAAAQERVAEAEAALKEATEGTDEYTDALSKLEEAEKARDSIEEYNTVQQAQEYYDLQQAIDATAAARGLDAEAVAMQAESIRKNLSEAGVDAKGIAEIAADTVEAQEALDELNKSASTFRKLAAKIAKQNLTDPKDLNNLDKMRKLFSKIAGAEDLAIKDTAKLNKEFEKFLKKNPKAMEEFLKGSGKSLKKWQAQAAQIKADEILGTNFVESTDDALDALGDMLSKYSDQIDNMDIGQSIDEAFGRGSPAAQECAEGIANAMQTLMDAGMTADQATNLIESATDLELVPTEDSTEANVKIQEPVLKQHSIVDSHGAVTIVTDEGPEVNTENPGTATGKVKMLKIVKGGGSGGKGGGKGGGGGGGGGAKEPKKVANKRKSQTVKRYKHNDAKRDFAEKAKKSEESKKDYLYGESKIAQMEKINKLAEKEARITADRIKESREYLVEDRQNLIKYMQKYGFEAEFDADGLLANYEQAWNKIYQELAALYEDNLLYEEEEKIEEDLNIKLEELEGALEDYENSLKELADDIEKYEESLFEMYDNKVEALEHKVEFKIELSEDDLEYLDFWIESLGDNIYNAIEAIEAMGAKANALFDGLETYQQGIMDIMSLSEDPLQVWATGGIEGILTQAQVDALRDNRDGLADYMQQLIDLREEIKDKVLDTFDDWQEKLDFTLTTIEHYTSVLEHFKNMIDIVGKDSLGLNNQFMANLEQNAINQSLDSIDANKAYYDNLVEIQQEAQEKLEEARARDDQSSADHWEEVVQSTTEAMQDAQDALLTSLEDSLNLIAEQFEANMERAVETFNDALYAYGGLEGLSNDYDRIRENADLMAADYEKIYELSKINRNINKTLDDTKIIAGKQKLKSLQKEINDLQNSGVELSKYDLEYLQAKYELRLAEIELENAQNAKSTVRLSKDDEGNWSYIYTRNEEDIEESYQKYEDALYEMQKLSQEYLEEMSSTMLDTSSAMMEEIQNLRIQDFNSYEEYQKEIKHIQDKYAESLRLQENELNKAVSNSQQIYEQDWRNYNLITGYKISDSEKWADAFRESTIGQLLNSDSIVSSFSDTILGLTDILTKNLSNSAVSYFDNIDKAFASYGTSIEDFGKHVEDTTEKISNKSKKAVEDAKSMASEMNNAFKEIAETVADWQEEFSLKIDEMLEKIKTLIQDINNAIETSAKYDKNSNGAENLIGSEEAIELLNKTGKFGEWSKDGSVGVKVDGKATNFIDYNAALIEEIDDAVARYANAKTGSDEREKYGEELKELFKRYWEYRDIVNRVYDPTNLTTNMPAPKFTTMDTGGYTGEWGDSGKFAMLHEKELVLNKDDTKNFLDALNISREVINSMIEMNARQSSLALGDLMPMSVQDTSQILEQSVTIQAEFPNATDHNEIEEAFNNLINTASQYANRYND